MFSPASKRRANRRHARLYEAGLNATMFRMSLILQNLCKSYPTRSGELPVLRNINLTLQMAKPSPSSARPDPARAPCSTCSARSNDPPPGPTSSANRSRSPGRRGLAHFRNRSIGFVFQDHHLLPQCSVLENVLIPTLAESAGGPARGEHEPGSCSSASDCRSAGPSARGMSGGERQRVAVGAGPNSQAGTVARR